VTEEERAFLNMRNRVGVCPPHPEPPMANEDKSYANNSESYAESPPNQNARRLIHKEASTALNTRRPELLQALRNRLRSERGKEDQDVEMLIDVLILSIQELSEKERRLHDVDVTVKNMNRALEGLERQAADIRSIISYGATQEEREP
jgi:hypothetical protein